MSSVIHHEPLKNMQAHSALTMETTVCPLCGSDKTSIVVSAADRDEPKNILLDGGVSSPVFSVVRCNHCELCYTNPRPKSADIGRFYKDDYAPYQLPATTRKTSNAKKSGFRRFTRGKIQNWERGEIDPVGECRLLDFGCGAGAFLERMHNRGWQVVGLDFSEKVVRQIRNELKLSALHGTLPHPELSAGSFDLVTLWHSLEHVHRPLELLGEVNNLLAPGGKVLVAVPNIDSAPFRWFGRNWYGLDVPRHLTHFTPATLGKMLERAGFEFKAMQMVRHSYWLRQSAELASREGKLTFPLNLLKHGLPSSIVSKCYLLAGSSDSFAIMARKK